jgi:hypothetical protein
MRIMRHRVVRVAFLLAMVALLAAAIVDQGGTLWREVQRLSAPVVAIALVTTIAGLICSLLVWRSILADLGSRLLLPDAWRIMFIGQLAKYIPGSVWPVIAQTELGADQGVPRGSSAVSVLVSYAVVTGTGALLATAILPFAANGSLAHYFWVLLLVPPIVAMLSPPVLNRVLEALLKALRRQPLASRMTVSGMLRSVGWALLGWLCNGTTVYVLMRQLAGHRADLLFVSIGAYALSWVVGFVAVFAPAGAGVREAVVIATLSSRTTAPIALTIALLTRALSVVSDGLTASVAAGLIGRDRLRRLRIDAAGDSSDHQDATP